MLDPDKLCFDEFWMLDDALNQESIDVSTLPEIKLVSSRVPPDDELGLRALLAEPEAVRSALWAKVAPLRLRHSAPDSGPEHDFPTAA
jgi:hypothetical protein